MRIVSLVPGATEIACALGLQDQLVGVTHECDWPPGVRGKPVVVRSSLPAGLDSGGIDAAVRARAAAGRSLYTIDVAVLRDLAPDVILTQQLCEVCAAARPELEAALASLHAKPAVLTLSPATLADVLDDIVRVGEATGTAVRARALRGALGARVRAVERAVAGEPRPRVAVLEWLDPPMQGGHWVPDMVARAGGEDVLGQPGKHARRLGWAEVAASGAEVLVLAPCGFDVARAAREGAGLLDRPELGTLPAVRGGNVVAMDANAHFSRPGPRLVDGLEALAAALHPRAVADRFPWASVPVAASPTR